MRASHYLELADGEAPCLHGELIMVCCTRGPITIATGILASNDDSIKKSYTVRQSVTCKEMPYVSVTQSLFPRRVAREEAVALSSIHQTLLGGRLAIRPIYLQVASFIILRS